MAATFSNGLDTVTPDLVLGISAAREARTVVHDILERTDPDASIRPAALRKGTAELFFLDEFDVDDAAALFAGAHVWTLTDPERLSLEMVFVVAEGAIETELDPQTRTRWLLRVPYREVFAP